MRATSSGIVIGFVLALLVPSSVVGQDPDPQVLDVPDPTLDFLDTRTGEGAEGPAFADITHLHVAVEEGEFDVKFTVSERVPKDAEPPVDVLLYVDRDGDGAEDATVRFASSDGWAATVTDTSTGEVVPLDALWVFADSIRTRVPMTLFGSPEDLRFHGQSTVATATSMLSDRVPDPDDVWLALGESPPPLPPVLFSASDLIAAGSAAWDAKSVPNPDPRLFGEKFASDPCARPAREKERGITCAVTLARAWREWQHKSAADGRVSQDGYESVLPAYQWAAAALSPKDKRYLDEVLLAVDATPLDFERVTPSGLQPIKAAQQPKTMRPDAMRRMLTAAWLDTLVPVVDGEEWAEEKGVYAGPVAYSFLSGAAEYGAFTLVSACEDGIEQARRPRLIDDLALTECAAAAAQSWAMYEATGDRRFLEVARGLKGLALASGVFDCAGGNASGAFDGILLKAARGEWDGSPPECFYRGSQVR